MVRNMANLHFTPGSDLPSDAPDDGRTQHAMLFDPDGSITVALDTAESVRKRYRDAGRLRTDARRTAEYLASRGLTPIESLHNVARMELDVAVPWIMEHGGCTRWQAIQFWKECAQALLPYTAPRFDAIDLSALAGAAAAGGSLAAAHFLAASRASEALVRDREVLAASGGPVTLQHQLQAEGEGEGEGGNQGQLAVLPPIAPD